MTPDRGLSVLRPTLLLVLSGVLAVVLAAAPTSTNATQLAAATAEGSPASSAVDPPDVLSVPSVSVTPAPAVPAGNVGGGAARSDLAMPPLMLAIVGMPLGPRGPSLDARSNGSESPVGLGNRTRYQRAFVLKTTTHPRKAFLAIGEENGLTMQTKVGDTGDLLQNGLASSEESQGRGIIFMSVGW